MDKTIMQNFVKHDDNKYKPTLVPINFVVGVAKVATFGAKKYDSNNWQKGEKQRYLDALLRHINAYLSGELTDSETGLSHLYHAGCNLAFIDWFDTASTEICDGTDF